MNETTPTTGYSSPAEAEAALTAAFTPPSQTVAGYGGTQFTVPGTLTPQQQAAIKNAASLVPTPAVITSDTAATEVKNAQQKLAEAQTKPPTKQNQSMVDLNPPTDNNFGHGDNLLGDLGLGDGTPKIPTYDETAAQIDNVYNNTVSLIESMQSRLDERSSQMMDSIKQRFALRREQQKRTNEAVLAGTRTAGIRSGRNRYATELQDSILAAEESAGLQRIAELDAQEQQLLLEAQAANDEKSYKLLADKISAYDKASSEKRKAVLDLFQISQQQEQMAIERSREARAEIEFERSQAEADALNLAVSNFDELMNEDGSLNEDLLNQMSADTGIDPAMIGRMVKQIELDNKASLPALVQEYQFAKDNGFSGSFMAYQSARASAGRAFESNSFLTAAEAKALGLPSSMAGMSEREIIFTFINTNPPQWYLDMWPATGKSVPSDVTARWKLYRSEMATVLEAAGILEKQSSSSSLSSSYFGD